MKSFKSMLTLAALLLTCMHLFGQGPIKYHRLELEAAGNGIEFDLKIYNPQDSRELIVEFTSSTSIDQTIDCLTDIQAYKAQAFLQEVIGTRPTEKIGDRWKINLKQYEKIKDAGFYHMTADNKVAAKNFTVI